MLTIRSFIAIEIPETIRTKIAKLQNNLKKIEGRVSWTKPENIHLTLKFLGDTDEKIIDEIATQLSKTVTSINHFSVVVKGVGIFPNFKNPRVIWVGAESEGDQLQKLARNIEDCMGSFGFRKENRRFSAHLTLGRVKDVKGIRAIIEKLKEYENFEAGSFVVTEFLLIKSQLHPTGSIYTPLKTVVLENQ